MSERRKLGWLASTSIALGLMAGTVLGNGALAPRPGEQDTGMLPPGVPAFTQPDGLQSSDLSEIRPEEAQLIEVPVHTLAELQAALVDYNHNLIFAPATPEDAQAMNSYLDSFTPVGNNVRASYESDDPAEAPTISPFVAPIDMQAARQLFLIMDSDCVFPPRLDDTMTSPIIHEAAAQQKLNLVMPKKILSTEDQQLLRQMNIVYQPKSINQATPHFYRIFDFGPDEIEGYPHGANVLEHLAALKKSDEELPNIVCIDAQLEIPWTLIAQLRPSVLGDKAFQELYFNRSLSTRDNERMNRLQEHIDVLTAMDVEVYTTISAGNQSVPVLLDNPQHHVSALSLNNQLEGYSNYGVPSAPMTDTSPFTVEAALGDWNAIGYYEQGEDSLEPDLQLQSGTSMAAPNLLAVEYSCAQRFDGAETQACIRAAQDVEFFQNLVTKGSVNGQGVIYYDSLTPQEQSVFTNTVYPPLRGVYPQENFDYADGITVTYNTTPTTFEEYQSLMGVDVYNPGQPPGVYTASASSTFYPEKVYIYTQFLNGSEEEHRIEINPSYYPESRRQIIDFMRAGLMNEQWLYTVRQANIIGSSLENIDDSYRALGVPPANHQLEQRIRDYRTRYKQYLPFAANTQQ